MCVYGCVGLMFILCYKGNLLLWNTLLPKQFMSNRKLEIHAWMKTQSLQKIKAEVRITVNFHQLLLGNYFTWISMPHTSVPRASFYSLLLTLNRKVTRGPLSSLTQMI